jgi:hypothetical protein
MAAPSDRGADADLPQFVSRRRGVPDLLGVPISISTVHSVLQLATKQAGVVNRGQDLSGIRAGLHDEIFQGAMPVLAGVDATSTYYRYLLFSRGTSRRQHLGRASP